MPGPFRARHWLLALGIATLAHAGMAPVLLSPLSGRPGAEPGPAVISLLSGGLPGIAKAPAPSTEADTKEQDETPVERPDVKPRPDRIADPETSPAPTRGEPKVLAQGPVLQQHTRPPQARPAFPLQSMRPSGAAEKATPPAAALQPPATPDRDAESKGTGGAPGQVATASAQIPAGSDRPDPEAQYMARLRALLESAKRYPAHARKRKQQGTVYLHFVVDRSGSLRSNRIEQSSGHRLLDREVERMLRRVAHLLPPLPDDLRRSELEVRVPVAFRLR